MKLLVIIGMAVSRYFPEYRCSLSLPVIFCSLNIYIFTDFLGFITTVAFQAKVGEGPVTDIGNDLLKSGDQLPDFR